MSVALIAVSVLMVPAKVNPISLPPAVTVNVTVSPTMDVPEFGLMTVMDPVGLLASMTRVLPGMLVIFVDILPAGSVKVSVAAKAPELTFASPSAMRYSIV